MADDKTNAKAADKTESKEKESTTHRLSISMPNEVNGVAIASKTALETRASFEGYGSDVATYLAEVLEIERDHGQDMQIDLSADLTKPENLVPRFAPTARFVKKWAEDRKFRFAVASAFQGKELAVVEPAASK